jgi:hypothetical protein
MPGMGGMGGMGGMPAMTPDMQKQMADMMKDPEMKKMVCPSSHCTQLSAHGLLFINCCNKTARFAVCVIVCVSVGDARVIK